MANIISISVDLSKLDKSKIIVGEKGQYYNMTLFVNDQADKWKNDVQVCEPQSKEERGKDKTFIGKGRVLWTGKGKETTASQNEPNNTVDDLPF